MLIKTIYSIILVVFLLPFSTHAMPCHCFSARDFDPGEPAAADPYYLATSQNSFFSVVFKIEKKQVVFAKQKPRATAEGLWILNWLALATGKETNLLKKEKKTSGSWQGALKKAGVESKSLPLDFWALLEKKVDDKQLAQYVVDNLLNVKKVITPEELQNLRQARASNEETILASFLGRKTGKLPSILFQSVGRGEITWGTLLLNAGMNGREMVEEIRALLGQDSNAQ